MIRVPRRLTRVLQRTQGKRHQMRAIAFRWFMLRPSVRMYRLPRSTSELTAHENEERSQTHGRRNRNTDSGCHNEISGQTHRTLRQQRQDCAGTIQPAISPLRRATLQQPRALTRFAGVIICVFILWVIDFVLYEYDERADRSGTLFFQRGITGILSATGRIRRGEPVGRPGVSPGRLLLQQTRRRESVPWHARCPPAPQPRCCAPITCAHNSHSCSDSL